MGGGGFSMEPENPLGGAVHERPLEVRYLGTERHDA